MKKNTYVTGALFVIFALLTVAYWNMDTPADGEPITMTLTELEARTAAEVLDTEDADAEKDEDAETSADANEDTDTEKDADERSASESVTSLQAIREETERQMEQQVASLTEILASADFDGETKNVAKNSLNNLESLANSSRALETVITTMGFSDVLVRAGEEFVQVTIEIEEIASAPSHEELAELYVLAGLQFAGHRNGNISIDFQPLN